VSHRKSLWKYHEYVLRVRILHAGLYLSDHAQFTGLGGYSFERISDSTEEFGS
jgi:hypothetical protein